MKNLNDLIEKYPKIFELMKDPFYRVSSGVPDSWLQVLDWLCHSIQSYIDNNNNNNPHLPKIPQLKCEQVKDKFGGLRFYYYGGDDVCDGMVRMAETILWDTCEYCGSHEDMQTREGWIRRLCKKCYDEENNN